MYISPPIAVLTIVGVAFAGMAWLKPPPRDEVRVSVTIPKVTYKKIVRWGQDHAGAEGQTPAVGKVIELLLISSMNDNASQEN